MAGPRVRPARRVAHRRTAVLVGPALAAGLVAAMAVAPGWATASPSVTGVIRAATDPATEPATDPTGATPTVDPTATEPTTAPPTQSPPPETTPPAPPTTEPAPTTTAPGNPVPTTAAPTTTAPAPPPVVPPAQPGRPAGGQLGVRVSTEDVSLTPAYWNADRTVDTLRVTVTNTGGTAERIRLGYRLPAGLTDAGTQGCVSAGGGSYRCGEWGAAPGARFSSEIRIRVAGTAWKSMPLSGSVRVTATAPGVTGSATDEEGFDVLFPPGPPVPGISLRADEVAFDISGAPAALTVRLGNTGKVDAAGRVDVIFPDGVTATAPPAGCTAVAPDRTRCDLGTLPAGRTTAVRLPVTATSEAQRRAPLAGAVVGRLDPRSGRDRQVQMSFRITAAAALAPAAGTPAPIGSQGVLAAEQQAGADGVSSTQQIAVIVIVLSGLLVVLALVLATISLRRRMTEPNAGGTPLRPSSRTR